MFNEELDGKKGQILFYKALVIVFFIRLIISAWLPITGDEAYFVIWGNNLDYGYYDHTPFVGWVLAALLTISDATWWLRLPSTLLPIFLSFGIYHILKPKQPKIAVWVALTFLVAPVNIINILITTDTPLVYFSFISAWFFYLSINSSSDTYDDKGYKFFILSGLFLGLAFFSKYFAVFLGFSYGLYIFLFYRNKRGFKGLGLIFLMVLPFVTINLWWNYNNCWSNILFNFYNRASGESDAFSNFTKYIGMLTFLLSPVIIYYVFKNKKEYKSIEKNSCNHIYLWMTIIPLTLFLFLLIRKSVGLHWMMSFYPFAFIAFSSILSIKQWKMSFYFMAVLSFIHLLIIVALLILPVTTFTSNKFSIQDYEFGMHPDKFLDKLKVYEKDYEFSMISYGMGSVASYYSNKHFIIFSEGSVHARADDKLTNFKELDGKNILLVKRSKENLEKHEQYFENTERKVLEVDGVRFELLLGKGFKYEPYRNEILSKVNEDYYNAPDWLPIGRCHLKEKYDFN